MNTLAIDIGGTKFTIALFEGESMARRESRRTDRAGGRAWMMQQIEDIVLSWRSEIAIDRCGIGFGGPVDFARQAVALSTHVEGWRDFPLVQRLRDWVGAPTVMDNDANAGALGEAVFGAGQGFEPLFYMTLSTGIGGGIILPGGSVYRGADSWAGEIGHVTIQPGGPECFCGARGCLERMCGGIWLERDFGMPASDLMQDPTFVKRYVCHLAQGLKAAVMLLNPARIVIGGGIAKAGGRLFVPLRRELQDQMTVWSGARVDVVPARLGDDSVLWGALELAKGLAIPAAS